LLVALAGANLNTNNGYNDMLLVALSGANLNTNNG
jgi:hypothetical protein